MTGSGSADCKSSGALNCSVHCQTSLIRRTGLFASTGLTRNGIAPASSVAAASLAMAISGSVILTRPERSLGNLPTNPKAGWKKKDGRNCEQKKGNAVWSSSGTESWFHFKRPRKKWENPSKRVALAAPPRFLKSNNQSEQAGAYAATVKPRLELKPKLATHPETQ